MPWACMYLLWNRANRECINTTAQPDLGGGAKHRPRETMLQRQSEALNTGPKCYSPLHCTRNSYRKRKETTVYTCKRLWSEKMNKGGGAMHWKGLPVYSPSSSSPPSPQSHLGSCKTLKSPAWYPSWPPGPVWAGRYPTAKNTGTFGRNRPGLEGRDTELVR